MDDNIRLYLENTRFNFHESIDDFTSHVDNVLVKNKIEIVVIWSPEARNETVISNEKITIIWDTNFWSYFVLYYSNLFALNQYVVEKSELTTLHVDSCWADLLRVAINRLLRVNPELCLYLAKHYLAYGKRVYSQFEIKKDDLIAILFAKYYVLLHEVAHITIKSDYAYFYDIVRNVITESKNSLFFQFKENNIDFAIAKNILKDIENNAYDGIEEIVVDAKAYQSLLSNVLMLFPSDIKSGLLYMKQAISFVRSYTLRLSNLEAILKQFFTSDNPVNPYDEFINQYLLRDTIIDDVSFHILVLNLGRKYPKDFFIRYTSTSSLARETPKVLDMEFREHIIKIHTMFVDEKHADLFNSITDISDVVMFLMYYIGEENENKINEIWASS